MGFMMMYNGKVMAYSSRNNKSHKRNYLTHDLDFDEVLFALKNITSLNLWSSCLFVHGSQKPSVYVKLDKT